MIEFKGELKYTTKKSHIYWAWLRVERTILLPVIVLQKTNRHIEMKWNNLTITANPFIPPALHIISALLFYLSRVNKMKEKQAYNEKNQINYIITKNKFLHLVDVALPQISTSYDRSG